jgi:ADP-L-glycero-D-manno-heptose 6-epimerase
MYGYSKQMFDMWILKNRLQDLVVGLKYFNVYGPREEHKDEQRSVVSKAYRQIQETGKVRLFKSYRPEYADGEQVRDFVYVKDAVEVTLAFHADLAISGIFNCGTGSARTWNDLVKAVFAALDRKPHIQYIDMPESIRDQYQYHTEADMGKLREAGYDKPFTSLEDGIRDYVQNYLVNITL